ncbi:MAG: hypothetical protein IPK79_13960 [Vampirovibrionales bacterium]|nr:hypothetical protein [Vampirovibrionales bacterium]
MTSYVYTAGIATATNINIRRYSFAGSSIDSISRSAAIYGLSTDSINSFYTVLASARHLVVMEDLDNT